MNGYHTSTHLVIVLLLLRFLLFSSFPSHSLSSASANPLPIFLFFHCLPLFWEDTDVLMRLGWAADKESRWLHCSRSYHSKSARSNLVDGAMLNLAFLRLSTFNMKRKKFQNTFVVPSNSESCYGRCWDSLLFCYLLIRNPSVLGCVKKSMLVH